MHAHAYYGKGLNALNCDHAICNGHRYRSETHATYISLISEEHSSRNKSIKATTFAAQGHSNIVSVR